MSTPLTAPSGFVFAEDVRKELGIASGTWRSRLAAAQVPEFSHPRDCRIRLIREADAERLLRPMPARSIKPCRAAEDLSA